MTTTTKSSRKAKRVAAQAAPKIAREYELVYILQPRIQQSEAKKVADRIQDVISKEEGRLLRVDHWGKRKLAYAIGGHTRGIYVCINFAGYGGLVAELERNLRNLDGVIRFQSIRLGVLESLEALEVDEEEIVFAEIDETEEEEREATLEERLHLVRGSKESRRRSSPPPSGEDDEDDVLDEEDEDVEDEDMEDAES